MDHSGDKILILCVCIQFVPIQPIQRIPTDMCFCFFVIEINTMQSWENPMLLVPQRGYLLGSRSIGFSWDRITLISKKKQTYTCFSTVTSRKCTRLYLNLLKKTLTDREIVLLQQFLVRLGLERAPSTKGFFDALDFLMLTFCKIYKNHDTLL